MFQNPDFTQSFDGLTEFSRLFLAVYYDFFETRQFDEIFKIWIIPQPFDNCFLAVYQDFFETRQFQNPEILEKIHKICYIISVCISQCLKIAQKSRI